MPKSSGLKEN